jgi:quinolinate synthase
MLNVVQAGPSQEEAEPQAGSLRSIHERIRRLKAEKDIILLAHNYQYPEIQEVADIRGDTLELAFAATKVPQPNIVFCGVDFMAEMAKILNPAKRVFIPDTKALCPLAGMADVEGVLLMKEHHPEAAVVAYVNSSSAVKAIADVVCASANALAVCKSMKEKELIFTPDQNFGQYLQGKLPEKKIHVWAGYCHVHQNMTPEQVFELRQAHPDAEVLVHPECPTDVIAAADFVASTGGMLKRVRDSPKREFIVGSERELTVAMRRQNPEKVFYTLPRAVCPTHKKITVRKLLNTMETLTPEVLVPEDVARGARRSLDRMLEFAPRE